MATAEEAARQAVAHADAMLGEWVAQFRDLLENGTELEVTLAMAVTFQQQHRDLSGLLAAAVRRLAGEGGAPGKIREAIAGQRCVQAGWAFGVPEDGREQWLDLVTAAVTETTGREGTDG